jgi:hypothetical protein
MANKTDNEIVKYVYDILIYYKPIFISTYNGPVFHEKLNGLNLGELGQKYFKPMFHCGSYQERNFILGTPCQFQSLLKCLFYTHHLFHGSDLFVLAKMQIVVLFAFGALE